MILPVARSWITHNMWLITWSRTWQKTTIHGEVHGKKFAKSPQKCGLYEASLFNHMNAKLDTLYQNIENSSVTPFVSTPVAFVAPVTLMVLYCEVCGLNGNSLNDCHVILVGGSTQDNINYVRNQRGNPYSNTYNPGCRYHPNISYMNNQPQNTMWPSGFQQGTTFSKSKLETMMESFLAMQNCKNGEFINKTLHTNEVLMRLTTMIEYISTHNKILETQISKVEQQ